VECVRVLVLGRTLQVIVSAKAAMFYPAFVCLLAKQKCNKTCYTVDTVSTTERIFMKFLPRKNVLNFGSHTCLDTDLRHPRPLSTQDSSSTPKTHLASIDGMVPKIPKA